MKIVAQKYHNIGNSIIILGYLKPMSHTFYTWLTHSDYGFGADQLILIHSVDLEKKNITIGIINKDGTSATMCVNGLLSLGAYLDVHYQADKWNVSIKNSVQVALQCKPPALKIEASTDVPRILVGYAKDRLFDFLYKNIQYRGHICDVGNVHIVFFIAHDPYVMSSEAFMDFCVHYKTENVFAHDLNISLAYREERAEKEQHAVIRLRTFERGVGETKACGSAAAACAYIYAQLYKENTVTVKPYNGAYVLSMDTKSVYIQGQPCYVGEITCSWDNYTDSECFL